VVWAYAFELYKPDKILEIGTGNGGFTIFLGVLGLMADFPIYSFDIHECPSEQWASFASKLPIRFIRGDVFEKNNLNAIGIGNEWGFMRTSGRNYILCDGPDKPREFNLFAQLLKPGDVIAAHDYQSSRKYWGWGEITKADVADTVKEHKLEPFMQEHFDTVGWLAYRKPL
jgi:hypothetical protein